MTFELIHDCNELLHKVLYSCGFRFESVSVINLMYIASCVTIYIYKADMQKLLHLLQKHILDS